MNKEEINYHWMLKDEPGLPDPVIIFKESEFKDRSAYDVVEEFLTEYFYRNKLCFEDIIVDLETTNLGRSNEYYDVAVDFGFHCADDWHEGGDVILHGYIPVSEVLCTKNFVGGSNADQE